jgi:hypothetical protein
VYDTLLLAADYSITAEAWGQQRYDLQHNLTVASAPGHVFKLEFDFVAQGLRVPKGLTVTLRSIALGKVRDTSGWSLPFFTGECGAAAGSSCSSRTSRASAAEHSCSSRSRASGSIMIGWRHSERQQLQQQSQ